MGKVWGGVLVVTGFIACPCHLVLTLPLVAGLVAGTGVGTFLAAKTGLVYGIAGGYFIVALAAGWHLLNRKRSRADSACPVPGRETTTRSAKPTVQRQ